LGRWLLLHYKIPPEPSAPRVYIWRKLKKIGAILYQDAVWVLPNSPWTREQFQWLTVEIGDLKGEATFWSADLGLGSQANLLVRQFSDQTDQAYAEILEKLKEPEPDLGWLSRQFQQIKARDYFHSKVGDIARERLLAARGDER
jgi:hypothetical protein